MRTNAQMHQVGSPVVASELKKSLRGVFSVRAPDGGSHWRNGGKYRGILKSRIRCTSFGILGAKKKFFGVLFRVKKFLGVYMGEKFFWGPNLGQKK